MSNNIKLTPENLQQTLGEASNEKLVALHFYSAQSPECVAQEQILSSLASQYQDHLIVATLDCDEQQAIAAQLAQQIGLQGLPTIVLLKASAPVDMLVGQQSESQIKDALAKHLPQPQELLLEQAKQALLAQNPNQAYSYAKQAYELDAANTRIKLVLADICIQVHKLDDAEQLLATVELTEQDAYYTNIQAKYQAAVEAKDSPEIKALAQQVDAEPDNFELAVQLANAHLEAGSKEQALTVLFTILKRDLSYGEVKKQYLEIIDTLPAGDSVATQYRRKLYSILY